MLLPVSIYGGYFGAGVGVLLLGVLSIATGGDYRSANATKNLVTASTRFAAVVCSRARRGELAADAGDDGRRADRRTYRRAARRASCRSAVMRVVVVAPSARC